MSDEYLRTRLEALAAGPATDDWTDALRRAGKLRKRRTRTIALAAAAAVLIAVPAVAVAVDAIDFWSAEPAPERVKIAFDSLEKGPPVHLPRPGVEAREARKIMAREFSGGTWTLYVGPTKSGGFCTFVAGGGGGGAGCTKQGESLSVSGDFVDELSPGVVSGSTANEDAEYVEVVLDRGAPMRSELVWVSDPIDAGFFMAEVAEWGRIRAVVLRSAAGSELARREF
jgi:hypothetical protein